jgi:hypothetical protein
MIYRYKINREGNKNNTFIFITRTPNSPQYVPRALREPVVFDSCVRRRVVVCPVAASESVEILTRVRCPVHGLQEAGG